MRKRGRKSWIGVIAAGCIAVSAILAIAASHPRSSAAAAQQLRQVVANNPAASVGKHRLTGLYGNLPLTFEANRGQTDSRVKFLSRGDGYTLFLTRDGATLALRSSSPAASRAGEGNHGSIRGKGGISGTAVSPITGHGGEGLNRFSLMKNWRGGYNEAGVSLVRTNRPSLRARKKQENYETNPISATTMGAFSRTPAAMKAKAGHEEVLGMRLIGANPHPTIEGVDALPGKANYFIGNDPKQWHRDVPMYAKVMYRDIYPGIDLVFYGGPSAECEPLPDRERSRGGALASFGKRHDAGARDHGHNNSLSKVPHQSITALATKDRKSRAGRPLPIRERFGEEASARQLEYDFILHPGANPDAIKLRF
ncbi:MAG TPA: hypothetical protein VMT58_00030, partial [Candidatus Binataceae bacterium]|nr:hypothetical protein [Candidatus Binataceae bacterium]